VRQSSVVGFFRDLVDELDEADRRVGRSGWRALLWNVPWFVDVALGTAALAIAILRLLSGHVAAGLLFLAIAMFLTSRSLLRVTRGSREGRRRGRQALRSETRQRRKDAKHRR
jgi:hypothetical protein